VFFDRWVPATLVHDGRDLQPGDRLLGPAVVDWPATTLVLHPGQRGEVNPWGDLLVDLAVG
jgi:N-methylhydantoinase A